MFIDSKMVGYLGIYGYVYSEDMVVIFIVEGLVFK